MEEVKAEREAGLITKDPGGHRRGARRRFCTDSFCISKLIHGAVENQLWEARTEREQWSAE